MVGSKIWAAVVSCASGVLHLVWPAPQGHSLSGMLSSAAEAGGGTNATNASRQANRDIAMVVVVVAEGLAKRCMLMGVEVVHPATEWLAFKQA